MKQFERAMSFFCRTLVLLLLFVGAAPPADAQSTRIQKYADAFGWTKRPNAPGTFQFTAAQFPGNNAFSAPNIVADQNSLYVAIGNNGDPPLAPPLTSQIVRLDTESFAVQAVISFPVGTWLNHIMLSPGKLWAGDNSVSGNAVYRIDLATNTIDLTIPTGDRVRGIAYGLGKILVNNQNAGTVRFYDAVTGAPLGSAINVGGPGSLPMYSDFNGTDFMVSVQNTGTLVKIDGTTMVPIATLAVSPLQFAPFCDGGVTYTMGTNISVVDDKAMVVRSSWTPPNNATQGSGGHFMVKVRNELWYAQHVSGSVGVFDAPSGTFLRSIPSGSDTSGLAFNGYDVFSENYLAWSIRRFSVEHVAP